jgi:hypothetical protein
MTPTLRFTAHAVACAQTKPDIAVLCRLKTSGEIRFFRSQQSPARLAMDAAAFRAEKQRVIAMMIRSGRPRTDLGPALFIVWLLWRDRGRILHDTQLLFALLQPFPSFLAAPLGIPMSGIAGIQRARHNGRLGHGRPRLKAERPTDFAATHMWVIGQPSRRFDQFSLA